jgi:hypothetical protein
VLLVQANSDLYQKIHYMIPLPVYSLSIMNPSYVDVLAEQLPVLCLFTLACLPRLRTVCSTLRKVYIPMVKAIRVDCIHASLATRGATAWLCGFPVEEAFPDDEREICVSVVHLPIAYPGVASKHLSVPVQCTVDGNTCWYRLVAICLGGRRCEACRNRLPQSYFHLLSAVYAYSLFFDADVDINAEDEFPHVFCMLSPHGGAICFDFKQFEPMLAAECFNINDGDVFRILGQAIHNPDANPFPLRLHEPYPSHGVDPISPCQNVGLTTTDMEYIEELTSFVFERTPRGIASYLDIAP